MNHIVIATRKVLFLNKLCILVTNTINQRCKAILIIKINEILLLIFFILMALFFHEKKHGYVSSITLILTIHIK